MTLATALVSGDDPLPQLAEAAVEAALARAGLVSANGVLLFLTPEFARIVRDCTRIIQEEVVSVKSLVDEFSQFARFPAAQPQPSDLNEVVESAVAVFSGRLDGITIHKSLLIL